MKEETAYKNAVLDDKELQESLKQINPKFGDFVTRVAGEVWGLPLIDQKTKALITIAIDVVNQNHRGAGNPFATHVNMALKQGVSREEIKELLLFLCVYAGFNKVAACFTTLNQIFDSTPRTAVMLARSNNAINNDYSARDARGKVAFYVLLWKREGISLELFDNYWKDVHGPVCARLPAQYQYWQFHVAHNQGGFCPNIPGLNYSFEPEDNFDGIAELTFESEQERQTWFQTAGILMDDERNVFRKAIGYNTSPGNSITYLDRIDDGAPNGKVGAIKFHVMVKKADGVSTSAFRQYLKQTFAPQIIKSDAIAKFRLHLFEEVDNSRPDAAGVSYYEPPEKQYQAAYEIAFFNHLEREKFFASDEYVAAIKDAAKYIKQIQPFPERTAYTFVYDGKMTLAGQRSSKVADLISTIGAANQLEDSIVSLMTNGQNNYPNNISSTSDRTTNISSGLGSLLQGVQHVGVTVSDMAKSVEFYTEVLGGKLVVEESELVGDVIQNTLFQKEELDAISQGLDSKAFDIPSLRSGNEDALDVKFISFGNTVVELIYFREAGNKNATHSSAGSNPSHIGHVNAMHISFNVKESIDLNVFANMLESESHKRGITNVFCNRIIRVKSEAERKAIALRYNSFKFWNDPEALAAGEPEVDWSHDPMEGWSLFYCKGPNGEQLEFNQVTRKVKDKFLRAQQEYDQANGTSFAVVNDNRKMTNITLSNDNGYANLTNLQPASEKNIDLVKRLFSRGEAFDSAGFVTFFTDKPLYQFGNFEICFDKPAIQQSADNFFSQINAVYHDIKMMWEVDECVFVEMDVTYWRKDNSIITLPCCDIFRVEGDKFSELRIFMDVNPVFNPSIQVSSTSSVMTINGTRRISPPNTMKKHFFKHEEGKQRVATGYAPKWSIDGPRWDIGQNNQTSGRNIDLVKRLFSRGEAFDSAGFVTFFTDTPLYQFGNFDICFDKPAIQQSADNFFSQINAVYHDIKMMWEVDECVFVEMDVTYWRKDNSVITLPCCDIFRVEGDKFSELRIFMDVNPVFEPSIKVPPTSSVMTIGGRDRIIPPDTMKKHFAEHQEGKQRVATGYAPKWSIDGPLWTIGGGNQVQTQAQSNSNLIPKVEKMVEALTIEDWESFYPYFTQDVYYKVGANDAVYGPQAAAQYLSSFYKIVKPTQHQLRGAWQIGDDTVIIEMDAHYRRISDGKEIVVPCADIYRFKGDLIYEWRVYPDTSKVSQS